jgi:hypothetical protein
VQMALTRVMRTAGMPPVGSQAGGITGVGSSESAMTRW